MKNGSYVYRTHENGKKTLQVSFSIHEFYYKWVSACLYILAIE